MTSTVYPGKEIYQLYLPLLFSITSLSLSWLQNYIRSIRYKIIYGVSGIRQYIQYQVYKYKWSIMYNSIHGASEDDIWSIRYKTIYRAQANIGNVRIRFTTVPLCFPRVQSNACVTACIFLQIPVCAASSLIAQHSTTYMEFHLKLSLQSCQLRILNPS